MPKCKPGCANVSVNDVPVETLKKLKHKIKSEAEKSNLPVPKLSTYVRTLIHWKAHS